MALSPEEDLIVYEALLLIAAPSGSPRASIVVPLNDVELQSRIPNGEPAQIVRQAMSLCLADGDRLNPSAMIRLLRIIEVLEPRVAAIIARLGVPAGPQNVPPNPFDDLVLAWNVPFLERQLLRAALKKLLEPNPTKPFIVVNGNRQQGKSYTAAFINHVLQQNPGIMSATVSLAPQQGAAVGPAEIASDIVTLMAGAQSARPQQVTNLERWYDELVNWVIEVGLRSPYDWWIVLDGFNAEELRADTGQFIAKLAKRLEAGLPLRRLRLILLDFDRTKLPVMVNKVVQDATQPVTKAQVERFIASLFQASAQPIDVAQITNKVMTDLPDPVTELGTLNERLSALIEEVRA